MEDPWGNFVNGKTGNGFARVTLLEDPSQNNLLKDIEISAGTLSPKVDYETDKYIVELDSETTELNIKGIPDDKTAVVEGDGTFDIPAGETKITIKVTAQSGDIKTYEVTVKRPASSNAKPINITIDGLIEAMININPEKYGKLNPEKFDPEVHEYSMIVPNKLKKLIFNVEKGHKYQTVTGDGEQNLELGANRIEIVVTSEDGNSTETYIYNIERDLSGNAYLKELSVTNVEEDIEFDPEVFEYYMIVPNEITHLDVVAIPEIETLVPEITGNESLEVGLNDVEVKVTAENGESLTYVIHVYRMMSGNTFLSDLKVYHETNLQAMTPKFNKILDTYKVTVPNSISEVDIVAVPEVTTTSVAGAGRKSLQTGVNIFSITTTAEDGSQDSYTVNIEREKSNNNYLKSLTASEGAFIESFDKNTQSYHISVPKEVHSLNLTYEVEDSTAKVTVLDNKNFKAGENIVTVRVTAEDGSIRDYQIIVDRMASDNNYLLNLWTDKGDLDPSFDKETLEYRIEVENEISRIKVFANKEDLTSKVTGTGEYALNIGENLITVSVMAENGDIKLYDITVVRKQNSNTNLLRIDNNKEANVAKVNDTTYKIEVDNDTKDIVITGVPEVSTSSVTGNGKKELKIRRKFIYTNSNIRRWRKKRLHCFNYKKEIK
ncbi:MAG: cadherin-like beta sandwich domain-containing protein [Clostridia bacterium]|nr:cadherin-like beta sandwich domain-containing protein [Clostridia bacterium]